MITLYWIGQKMIDCQIECTAIPDGFTNSGRDIPQLSILLRPVTKQATVGDDEVFLDLSQWPTEIPKLRFDIWVGTSRADLVYIDSVPAESAFEADLTAGITKPAQMWWDSLWADSGQLENYLELINGRLSDHVGSAQIKSYNYADLHDAPINHSLVELLRGYASFEVNRMVNVSGGELQLEAELEGLGLRAARDPNDPMVRIARDLQIARAGAIADVRRATIWGAATASKTPMRAPATKIPKTAKLHPDFAKALDPERLNVREVVDPSFSPFSAARTKSAYDELEEALKTDDELKAAPPYVVPDDLKPAHEVLGTLQAHPALRKFIRQIADIALNLDKLKTVVSLIDNKMKGVIGVTVSRSDDPSPVKAPDKLALTAFELHLGDDPFFEPCPRVDFDNTLSTDTAPASLPLREGFVNPTTINGDRQFQIASIDAIAAYFATTRGTQATLSAFFAGSTPQEIDSEPSGFRTRGLMLLYKRVKDTAEAAERRIAEVADDPILFAEDLVDGYRVDVVAPNGAAFSACARQLTFQAFEGLNAEQRRFYMTERNDGSVSPLGRTWTDGADPKKTFLSVSQVVLTWTGANFGLPGSGKSSFHVASDPLSVGYGFDPARQGAILRNLRHYKFVLRPRKLNGSSRTLSPDLVKTFALGSELDKTPQVARTGDRPDKGYQFALVEKAPAPTVLIDAGFRPQTGPNPADRETTTTVLVRTGMAEPAIRWLVSPITGFDLAELQGQFDPKSKAPNDRARAERHSRTGAYLYLQHTNDGAVSTINDGAMLLGQGFLLREPNYDPHVVPPHFVDATIRTISAKLVATKSTPEDIVDGSGLNAEIAFFREVADFRDFEPDNVVPVRLEIRAVNDGRRSRIFKGADFRLKLPGRAGRVLMVPTICVEVAPADTLELQLWSNRTLEAFRANPIVASLRGLSKGAFSSLSAMVEPASPNGRVFYEQMTQSQRIAALSDVARLRIEHPVARPLSMPAVVTSLQIFRAADVKAWEETTKITNGTDQEDAAKVFSTGRVAFDRKSTGELWAEAFWEEPESVIFRTKKAENPDRIEQSGLYDRKRRIQFRRLFSLPSLTLPEKRPTESAADYLKRINEIDLLLDDDHEGTQNPRVTRNLSAEFDCDQHRLFAVRIVARSRSAPADVPAAAADESAAPDDDAFTQASATRASCLHAIETPENWPSDVIRIEVPATRRPAPPYPTREKGTLYHRSTTTEPTGTTLSYIHRIWFDGNWGDDKFAIVCKRPRSPALPGWADTQLSRWGGDMTSIPGQELRLSTGLVPSEATYLMANQIAAADETAAMLWRDQDNAVAEVSLACLRDVTFHDGFGKFYCDVELKPTGAFKAGLKLVVARYQPNALPGRQLSSTVPIDTVMLPQPWHFAAERSGKKITVTITGPAYQGRAPKLDGLEGVSKEATMRLLSNLTRDTTAIDLKSLTQAPLIVAELERLDGRQSGPLPVLDGGRLVVASSLDHPPETVTENVEGFLQPLALKRWRLSLTVPDEDMDKPLSVRVSLASAHANSHARKRGDNHGSAKPGFQPSALDGALVFLPEPMVVQLRV
ncbi:hypothetical protein [Sinorhizobium meliloti]|uniref:hypothetical protein n=1 Tax=Rhizobium meliloti TaxID=382 RepID=UPI001296789F|nr:hypothetical protein [Sinorhizobium meliloti]MQV05908.1 hypothetical protein [Sinorhizobium meliloti]